MEPLVLILVPGMFGGLVLALLIAGIRPRFQSIIVPRRLAAPSPALINMAHIPVEGVGGLGIVAAVLVVAAADPRIRLATVVAFGLGTVFALLLIATRRRTGALPSGGGDPDGPSTLRIDGERRPTRLAPVRGTIGRVERAGAMRVPATVGSASAA